MGSGCKRALKKLTGDSRDGGSNGTCSGNGGAWCGYRGTGA